MAKRIVQFIFCLFVAANAAGQTVSVITNAIPPVNAVINQYVSSGNITCQLLNNTPVGNPPLQVLVYGKIECVSPSPFTISVNPSYAQQGTVALPPGVPVALAATQQLLAFGAFSSNNLVATGLNLASITDVNGNISLPAGTYRICYAARQVDPASGQPGAYVSDPNLGCGTFVVCTKATAPQFTQPVSNFNINGNNGALVTVQKISPVVFAWTPPNSTCGGRMGLVTYDFEIHEMFSTQTITDAINNPPAFIKRGLTAPTFLLDTILYKDVLQPGRRYVTRVKANVAVNSDTRIDNQGYSRIEAFQYDNTKPPGPPSKTTDENNNPPKINAVGGDCGLKPPSNTSIIAANESLAGKDIKVGEFILVPTKITRNNDNTYSGEGTVNWNPLIGVAKLKVAFDKIKINTDKAVFDGEIVTQTDPGVFKSETFDEFKDFAKKTGKELDGLATDIENFINKNPATRLLSQLTGSTPVDLPIGFDDKSFGNGPPVTMAIMNIVFSPKGATMSLLFNINIEEANGWLTLAGSDFCIHPTGVGLSKGTLFLPTDRDFNIGSGGNNMNIKFKGCHSADSANGTYVSWDNNKISDIVAHAEISFPQNVLVPEDDKGNIVAGAVVAKLLFRFKEWEDWIATIDLPHFQVKDVKGLSFQPTTIYYDHSVKSNAAGFTYPSNGKGSKGNDFEGLYMKEFKLLLPEDFKTFNQKQGERTEFTASDLIIDKMGLSVQIQGKNVIDISTGNLGGWGYSLDNIEVEIVSTTFTKGKMEGKFLLPVSKTPLNYSGDLHLGKDSVSYAFLIKPSAKMSWDIWKASVELKPNSYIEVKKDSLGAAVTALMNGDISIILSDGAPALKFEAIKFDSLGISNRNIKTKKKEFWISQGNWAFASPQKSVAGFPVSLGSIAPYVDMKSEIEAGLRFKLSMGIGGADKTIVGAEAKLALYGAIKIGLEDYRPNFTITAGVRADSIRLFGDVGPMKVEGWLAFYKKDNVYGDGIKGHVKATFPVVEIEATAQFGNVNNFNYWFIDACAQFATPVPVVGPIGINGFGGGAYYNMKLQNDPPKEDTMLAKNSSNNGTPGSSMSGIKFVPDEGSFGLRATALVCMVSGAGPKAMNAKITLGAEIKNGAFQNLNLTGDIYVFTNPPKNDNAIVTGHVEIIYDIPAKEFSLAALVKGKFSGAVLTVPINLYTSPKGWYFKIGDPWAQKVTLTFPEQKTAFYHYKIGASAYFVAGSLIDPKFPDLPIQITKELGLTAEPKIQSFIDEMNKTPGSGMLFGAEVDGSVGFTAAIIYADAEALIGFDMMLKNFESLTCGGGKTAGWENWYAMGQLYAYLKLDVGLMLDVWFYTGKVSLVKFAAGAYLRGGLPNPTWMEGAVAINGEVLGGLVKVNTSAHFSIGDKCYPDPDPLKDVKIISDYGPKGNKESVFVYPYAASNVGLEKNYEIMLPDGEVRVYQFRIRSFRLLKNGTTEVAATNLEYQNENNTVLLKRNNSLDPYTNYTGEIQCYALQYVEGKGWTHPKNDKKGTYEPVEEISTFSFKTGAMPDNIPNEIISFSYPVNKQRFVLKNEMNGNARIHIDQSMTNILIGDGKGFNAVRKYAAYFIAVGTTDTIKSTFTWNETSNDIDYKLPPTLKNNTAYKVEFWSFEQSGMMMVNAAVLRTQSSMSKTNIKGIDIEKKETVAISAALKMPKPIYTMYFRTSNFNTLSEKINAMGDWSASMKNNALNIMNNEMATEHFDEFETKGFYAPNGINYYAPLLNIGIGWDNNKQNDRFAADNLYANSFTLAFKQVQTDFGMNHVREFGGRPVNTIDLSKLYSDQALNNTETGEAATIPKTSSKSSSYSFQLPNNNLNKSQISFSMGYQSIVWDREKYLLADHKLLKEFAYAVSLNAGAFFNWSPQKAESVLSNLGGNVYFSWNEMGGYITMPWNKFYYLYSDPKYMNIVNDLKVRPFTVFPKGNRAMQFGYRAGNMQGSSVSKTFQF